MAHPVVLPWQHSWLQSLSSLDHILPFVTVKREIHGPVQNIHNVHIALGLLFDLYKVDVVY